MMRATVYQWLSESGALQAIVGQRIYPVNVLDTKPSVPYLVYKMSTAIPRVVPAKNQNLQVWAHDDRGDYTVIDNILNIVKSVLRSKESQGELIAVEWLDDSDDLFDDTSATINRYSRYQLVLKDNQ